MAAFMLSVMRIPNKYRLLAILDPAFQHLLFITVLLVLDLFGVFYSQVFFLTNSMLIVCRDLVG